MNPLVSVIVPVYCVEEYLALCVESILVQTYANLEVILVDDGSPDRSPAMCDAYGLQDSRVKVVHKENGGLSDARNAGIAMATGEYITFVDGDDILAPQAIEEMVHLAAAEQAEIVKISLERKYPGQSLSPTSGSYEVLDGTEVLSRIYTSKPQIISACGKLFKTTLFQKVLFPVGRYYEDEYTTPKLYHLARRVVLSESVQYFYMQWENESIMRTALTEKKIADALFVTNDRIDFFKKIGEKKLTRKAIADHYIKLQKLADASAKSPELAQIHQQLMREKRNFGWKHPLITGSVCAKIHLSRFKHMILNKMKRKSSMQNL